MADDLTPFEEAEVDRSDAAPQPAGDDRRSDGWQGSGRSRSRRASDSWIGGAILVVVGLAVLARNLGLELPFVRNWWALFIFVPALGALSTAWSQYLSHGRRFTREARGSLLGGLVMVLVALTFLFGWSWNVMLPAFLILAGLSALLVGVLGSQMGSDGDTW